MYKIIITLSAFVFALGSTAISADWNLDKAHSSVNFSVRHMVVSKTKGNFNAFDGNASFDTNDFTKGKVSFTVDLNSVDTDNQKRDDHLRSPDFFDVEKYPNMIFESKKVNSIDKNNFELIGDLTIKEVTKEVVFKVEFHGQVDDPWGSIRAGFTAKSSIDRQDFNISFNKVMETGGLIVGDEVAIELELEWVQAKPENASAK